MNTTKQFKYLVEISVVGLLACVLLLSSCCPKVTPSTIVERSIDTVYVSDTVTVHDTTYYATEFNVDSLLDLLNKPLPPAKQILSTTSNKGVTTTLSIVNGKLLCQSTIDSLQAIINKPIITNNTTTTVTKVVEVCNNRFHKFLVKLFWLIVIVLLVIGVWKFSKMSRYPF